MSPREPCTSRRTADCNRMRSWRRAWGTVAATLLASVLAACSSGPYIWYRDVPRAEWGGGGGGGGGDGDYIIGVGDVISVQVYDQPALATKAKIRSDGRVALPFVGEIPAVGKRPAVLSQELAARLQEFFVSPRVTVNIEESQPVVVSVMGEVGKVGSVTLPPTAGLLDALAQAGGPSDYADRSAIFVIRKTPEFRRIRFTYDALVQNKDGAATLALRTGDVIVVE